MAGRQLGRWCRRCHVWVESKAASCPTCGNRLSAPELMPDGTDPLARRKRWGAKAARPEASSAAVDPEGQRPLAIPPPPDPAGPSVGDAPADAGAARWDPLLPPIPGVDDQPPPEPASVDADTVSRGTLVKIVAGAAVVLVVGLALLTVLGSDDESDDADVALPTVAVPESIPFEVPEVPEPTEPGEARVVPLEEWDPYLRDLVDYIETRRQLRFQETVEVRLLSTPELVARFGQVTADPVLAEYLGDVVAAYRGLGIWEGGFDAGGYLAQAGTAGLTGLYSPLDDVVYVNRDAGTAGQEPGRSPFQRAVILHELVHALQDQHADLSQGAADVQEFTMQRMMVEGDARRIEREYVATLPDQEQEQYRSEAATLLNLEGLDGVLGIEADFIYEGGLQVTRLVETMDSSEAVDTLLAYPPDHPAQLLRVSGLFLHGQEPWVQFVPPAEYPDYPDDAFAFDGGAQGAWIWYVTMATRLDPQQALRAADAIGSDRYVLYTRGGGAVCGSYEVVAADDGDAGHLVSALRAWGASLPHGADISVDGNLVNITVCDPGAGAAMNFTRPPQDVVDGPIARTGAVAEVLEPQRGWWAGDELLERERWCLAETVQRSITIDEALAGLSDDRVERLGEDAVKACLPDRVPGGPPPFEGDCAAEGMEYQEEVDGLPEPVAAARLALLEAATACDVDGLGDTFAESGPYLDDGGIPAIDQVKRLTDRWDRIQQRGTPVLADLVATLSSGFVCGPDLAGVIEGRDGGSACAFLAGGRSSVDDRAHVVLIGTQGGFLGFGSNGEVQGEVLQLWAEIVTGSRNAGDYASGGGEGVAGLPQGWPVGVPPAALLDEE